MSQLINRDAFSRTELHRKRVYESSQAPFVCKWCGHCRHTPTGRPYLFKYWSERNDQNGKQNLITGLYCSTDCLNAYNT